MGGHVPEGCKPPYLAKYDGRSAPYKDITFINMHMVIIGAPDSLKCKLLSGTLREASLRWYMVILVPIFTAGRN